MKKGNKSSTIKGHESVIKRRPNKTNDSLSDRKGYWHLGVHGKNALGILIFIMFLSVSLFSDQWENSYIIYYDEYGNYNFGMSQGAFYGDFSDKNYVATTNIREPQPLITPLGDSDINDYPYVFFYEPFTQNSLLLDNAIPGQEHQLLLNETTAEQFNQLFYSYGRSAYGVYSIGRLPKQDKPGYLWIDDGTNRELQTMCILPDLSEPKDGTNDLFLAFKRTQQFPSFGNGTDYETPRDIFLTETLTENGSQIDVNPELFYDYFDVIEAQQYGSNPNESVQAVITSKPIYYQNLIYSGKGPTDEVQEVIYNDFETDFGNLNIIDAVFVLNQTGINDDNIDEDGNLVLLHSSEEKMAYYMNVRPIESIEISINSYNLTGDELWSISKEDILSDEDGVYSVKTPATSIITPETSSSLGEDVNDIELKFPLFMDSPIKLRSLDNGYLLASYTTDKAIRTDNNDILYLGRNIEVNFVFNATSGKLIWKKLGTLIFDDRPWFEKIEQAYKLTSLNSENSTSFSEESDDFDPSYFNSYIYSVYEYYDLNSNEASIQIDGIITYDGEVSAQYRFNPYPQLQASNNNSIKPYFFNFQYTTDLFSNIIQRPGLVGIISPYSSNNEQSTEAPIFLRLTLSAQSTYVVNSSVFAISAEQYLQIVESDNEGTLNDKLIQAIINQANEDGNYLGCIIEPLSMDIDFDGIDDYILIQSNFVKFLSGVGKPLRERDVTDQFMEYLPWDRYNNQDLIGIKYFPTGVDYLFFFNDPKVEQRISCLLSSPTFVYYFENINTYKQNLSFSEYFSDWSLYLFIGLGVLAAISLLVLILNFKKIPEKLPDRSPKLTRQYRFSVGFIFITYILILSYFRSLNLNPRTTDIFISETTSIYWFFVVYPLIFILISFIPMLYNLISPKFAEKIFLRLQKMFFKFYTDKGWKDYNVLVMHMRERRKARDISYISRSILPLLMGFTIGINIYTGLAEGGSLLSLLRIWNPNLPALTNPANLGVYKINVTSINEIWVEMGKYARYMVLGLLISFFISGFIIAPAWLLDDAGVVFYVRCKNIRGINDIDSVASWFLNFFSGVFGIATIIAWGQLFLPMLRNLNNLMIGLSGITQYSPQYSVALIIIALIIYPILATIALMSAANQRMEQKIVSNSARLFSIMTKEGYDIIPKDITAIPRSRNSEQPGRWTKYILLSNEQNNIKEQNITQEEKKDELVEKEHDITQEEINEHKTDNSKSNYSEGL